MTSPPLLNHAIAHVVNGEHDGRVRIVDSSNADGCRIEIVGLAKERQLFLESEDETPSPSGSTWRMWYEPNDVVGYDGSADQPIPVKFRFNGGEWVAEWPRWPEASLHVFFSRMLIPLS